MTLARLFGLADDSLDAGAVAARGVDDRQTLTRGQLLQNAAHIAAVLPPSGPRSQVALAFGHDRAALLAALLATWSRGHCAAIAENASRERILPVLQHPDTVAMLHDTDSGRAHQVPRLLADGASAAGAGAAAPATPRAWIDAADPTDAGERAVLACSTMARDGTERWQTWTALQLEELLTRLARSLPLTGPERIVHDFTPGFPPALFAACLLPLARGTAVDLDRPADAAALAARSQDAATRALLCSAPMVASLTVLGTSAVRSQCPVLCFGELPASTKQRAAFDAASLQLDGTPASDGTAGATGAGRPCDVDHDPAVDALRLLDGVDDVAAMRVPSTPDTVLVAIAGPAADAIAVDGPSRPPLAATADVRMLAMPGLPRDANRQLMPAPLFLAFGFGRAGQAVTRKLTWQRLSDTRDDDRDQQTASMRVRLPDHYAFFEGHFTDYPVTAGAVQLHELVLPCLRRVCAAPLPPLQQLDGVKFLARFGPGDTIDVVLRRDPDPSRIAFEIRRDTTRCTAGRASFAAAVPDFAGNAS